MCVRLCMCDEHVDDISLHTYKVSHIHWSCGPRLSSPLYSITTGQLTLVSGAKTIHDRFCHRLLWKYLKEFFKLCRSHFDAVPHRLDDDHSFLGWCVRSDQHFRQSFCGNQFLAWENFGNSQRVAGYSRCQLGSSNYDRLHLRQRSWRHLFSYTLAAGLHGSYTHHRYFFWIRPLEQESFINFQ